MKKTFLLCTALSLLSADARAKITEIQVIPPAPVIGMDFQVKAIDDGTAPPAAAYAWFYTQEVTGTGTSATRNGTGAGIMPMTASYPGTYHFGVKVIYPAMSGLPTAVFKVDCTIAKADQAKPIGGTGISVQLNTAVQVVDQIFSGGCAVGPMIAGTAQERFTNRTFLGAKRDDDFFWSDGEGNSFEMHGGKIWDWWWTDCDLVSWSIVPPGKPAAYSTQWLQIEWVFTAENTDNIYLYQSLGSIRWETISTGPGTWMVLGG